MRHEASIGMAPAPRLPYSKTNGTAKVVDMSCPTLAPWAPHITGEFIYFLGSGITAYCRAPKLRR